MKRTKRATLPIGTISEGTLRTEDLITSLLWALEQIKLTRTERDTVSRIRRESNRAESVEPEAGEPEPVTYFETEAAAFDLEELQTIASDHCPEYCDFGSSEGDGARIGVWPSLDSVDADGIERVAEMPTANAFAPYYVLQVSDHGNATLCRRAGNRWIEVWSVV